MVRTPRSLSQDEIIRALCRGGGVELKGRGKGSHRSVRMPGVPRAITIPRVVKTGLLNSIIKAAGLTVEEFRELL